MSSAILRIVIPTHNRLHYVGRLINELNSVVCPGEIEVYIVDDCSAPNVVTALRGIERENSLVKFIYLDKNCGAPKARNIGATKDIVDWLWFLDDDDWVAADTVLKVLSSLKNSTVNNLILLSARNHYGESVSEVIPSGNDVFYRFSRYGNDVNTSCCVINYGLFERIGGWDESLVAGQDADFLLRAAELSEVTVFPNLFVEINHHAGERITTNPKRQMRAKLQFIIKNYRRLHFVRLLRYVLTFLIAYPYIRKIIKK